MDDLDVAYISANQNYTIYFGGGGGKVKLKKIDEDKVRIETIDHQRIKINNQTHKRAQGQSPDDFAKYLCEEAVK